MRVLLLALAALAACRVPGPLRRAGLDSATTRPLEAAPVIQGPTVVAFWLSATDTLAAGDGLDLLDDFRAYTALVAPALEDAGIALEATTADSIVVEIDGGPRRVIMLTGLDYPFGYVLVEPGFPETILTGVSTDDELMEQVDWYFGSEGDDVEGEPPRQMVRAGYPIVSCTRCARPAGVNGFCRKLVLGSRVPCCRMASSVYPET